MNHFNCRSLDGLDWFFFRLSLLSKIALLCSCTEKKCKQINETESYTENWKLIFVSQFVLREILLFENFKLQTLQVLRFGLQKFV